MTAFANGRVLLDDAVISFGTWIKLAAPEVVEIAAYAGFDFIVLDLEHAMLGDHAVGAMIGTARHAGILPLVRVAGADRGSIQRTLDAGAAGLLVPRIDSVDEAEAIVDMARFPPLGSRGLSTGGRAGRWGAVAPREYIESGDECLVIVQMESAEALRHAEAIAAVPGIDAVFLGPMDLTASMGRPFDSERITGPVADLEAVCVRAGIPLGTVIGADPATTVSSAYRFLVLGSDVSILRHGAQTMLRTARPKERSHRP